MFTGQYKQILAPVDGSQASINAFKKAVHIAKRNDAEVHLVAVLDKANKPEEAELIQKEKDELFEALEDYARQHEFYKLHKKIKTGNAKNLIAEELVKDWDIDLIVMGATGKGRIARMVVGSITNHVIRHARCDVLIVRS